MLFEEMVKDAESVPQTIAYKINNGLATLEDQKEALKNPYWTYIFARCVPGADIDKCQEAACKNPQCAYLFAYNIPGAGINKCQEAVCNDFENSEFANYFAHHVAKADVEKCRKACEGTMYAF